MAINSFKTAAAQDRQDSSATMLSSPRRDAHALSRLMSAVLLFQLAASLAPPLQAQTKQAGQEPGVKLTSQLVELRAVVTNKQGQPVNDLKKEDFEVQENGRPQGVSFFSAESIGGALKTGSLPAASPEKPSAPKPPTAQVPARTLVIFVDTLTMEAGSLLRSKRALGKFVDEQITDRDMTALVATSGTLGLNGLFTSDKKVLHYMIDRLSPTQLAPTTMFTPYIAYSIVQGDRQALGVGMMIMRMEEHNPFIRAPEVNGRARQIMEMSLYHRKTVLAMLGQVVDRLAGTPGQRIVALLSDGISTKEPLGGNSLGELHEVISRAARTGVVLYTINTKGLQDLVPATVKPTFGSSALLRSFLSSGDTDLKDGLRTLAEETGGEALINTNDIIGSLRKTLDSNSSYYALAYYPEDTSDKRFRKITVRIKDHPEYHVRTQKGYAPLEPKKVSPASRPLTAQERLLKAILEPLPVSGVGVETWADYFEREGEKGQVYLHTHIAGGDLRYAEDGDKLKFKFTLAVIVYDYAGNPIEQEVRTHEGDIKAERSAVVRREGFFQSRQLALKAGIYQVRTGVTDEAAETTGTCIIWLKVPDFGQKSIVLSGVLVGNSLADSRSSAIPQPLIVASDSSKKQPIKIFRASEALTYVFRIYNPPAEKNGSVPLEMQIEFLKDGEVITHSSWLPVGQRQVAKDPRAIELGGGFKLDGIKPGVYSIRVSVRVPGSTDVVQNETPFAVEQG
jgi:VWFA-related protein